MVSGLPFCSKPGIFFILLKATVPYTLGDISVDTNLYSPLGTYLSDSTYCGEQFLEDASPFYSFDENKVKLFSYDSFGRLVKINNTPFASYDSFGRPVSYNGNILSWYGGNLKSFGNINLYYDLSGRRIKKVNGNKVTHYLYDEQGRLLREKFDGSDVPYITYMYDSSGAVGFMLPYAVYDLGKRHISERPFYYVKDLTGNIRRIVDSNGKCVIKYDYDAWGRVISAEYSDTLYTIWENAYFNAYSIGQLNSLIYKDYYYDKDLELYYLQTRYYDPTVCRFISPDSADYLDCESINGLNLYAYCLNNPVMYADPTGHFALPNWAKWLIGGVAFIGAVALTYLTGGALLPVFIGMAGSILLDGVVEGAISFANDESFWKGFADGAANGAISTGISLMGLGGWSILAGLGLILIGAGTMAFGANEVVDAMTGTNYIQKWTGMSDSAYAWSYLGLNFASSIGQAAGNMYHLHATRQVRFSNNGANVKGYRYFDRKGNPFFDFDYPHGNIQYNHWHGWGGPGLTNRSKGDHWSYLELIWWMFGGM